MQQNNYRINWIPEDDSVAANFPNYITRNLNKIHPRDDRGTRHRVWICVSFNRELPENQRKFHLVFYKDMENTVYSLFRSTQLCLLSLLCDRCRLYSNLFEFILKEAKPDLNRIKSTVRKLAVHPLWTDLHILDPRSNGIVSDVAAREFYLKAQQMDEDRFKVYNNVNNIDYLIASISKKDSTFDVNFQDSCGNTLLHFAVTCLNLQVVQLLLCLGANPNIANNSEHSSLHIASQMNYNLSSLFDSRVNPLRSECVSDIVKSLRMAGATRCSQKIVGCTEDCIAASTNIFEVRPYQIIRRDPQSVTEKNQNRTNTEAMEHVCKMLKNLADSRRKSNVISALSLDGGGVKGLGLLQLLIALEEKLGDRLMNYFDWVAGTSTGSIVAAAMARDIPLRDIQKMYLRFKDRVFGFRISRLTPYSAETLEEFLKDVIGERTTLAEISYPRMFFTTVNANHAPPMLVLQRTYNLNIPDVYTDNRFERPQSVKLWKAIRKSTAAPTYFTPCEGFIDGGLAANNPSLDLITEILSWNESESVTNRVVPGCLISLGCGTPPQTQLNFGFLRTIKSMATVIIEQVAATEGHPVDRARTACHSHNVPFFRLNPNLSEDVDLAETRNTKLIQMMWDAFTYTKTHSYLLDEIVTLLKQIGPNHERRPDALHRR